jgi:hypothetical protein
MGQAQWHQPERVTAHVDASIVGCAALSIRVASHGRLSTCSGGSAADSLLGGNAELVPEGRERVGLVEVSAEGGIEDARGHRRRQRAREGDVDALHAATMNLVDSLQAPVRVPRRVVTASHTIRQQISLDAQPEGGFRLLFWTHESNLSLVCRLRSLCGPGSRTGQHQRRLSSCCDQTGSRRTSHGRQMCAEGCPADCS